MALSAGAYQGRVGGSVYSFATPELAQLSGLGGGHSRVAVVGRAELGRMSGPIWMHPTEELEAELSHRALGLGYTTEFPRQTLNVGGFGQVNVSPQLSWFVIMAVGAASAAVAYKMSSRKTRVGRAVAAGIGVPALLIALGSTMGSE